MRITTLIENHSNPENPALKAEHGLSFYIEHRGHGLLSDVGATAAFAENAVTLGADLARVEAVTLSHHHYDHGGGLARFFTENDRARVYLRRAEPAEYVVQEQSSRRYIGLDLGLLAAHADRIVAVGGNPEILPGVHVLTDIPALHPKSSSDRRLMMVREGQAQPDTFEHEQVTVLEGVAGLVVLTGCAHNGVLNMIEAARQALPGKPIRAVIGGFHLLHEEADAVREIGETLLAMDIPAVYTGHCTGEASVTVLAEVLGERLHRLYTGLVLEI